MKAFYDYIFVQQDANKKTLKTKFSFSRNFNQYIREFQVGIKAQDEDKYDMLTNKIQNVYSIDLMIFFK